MSMTYYGLQMIEIRKSSTRLHGQSHGQGNIERIEAVSCPRDSPLTRKCNEGETAQLRPVVGALSWVTRRCKPELLYRVSGL
eukprot:8344246-Pyramimonas_sp.AAC.1